MIKHYDESVKINHNLNWPFVPDHPYRIWIIGGLGSGKTNVIKLNKTTTRYWLIYLYIKDPLESKYQLRINGREWKKSINSVWGYDSRHIIQ